MTLELHVRPAPPHVCDVLQLGEEELRQSLADTTRVIGRI
jgi:hypothetical protein